MTGGRHALLLVLLAIVATTGLFGAASEDCEKFNDRRKPVAIDKDNKYGLWPGLLSANDLMNGENIYGVSEAMEKIWQNQNPSDCSKAKYLLSGEWFQGFGSEVYFHGVALAIAMDTGRVFVQQGGYTWRYNNDFCRNQSKDNIECYVLPYSKCTLQDAMNSMKQNHQKHGYGTHRFSVGNRTVSLSRISQATMHYPNGPLTLSGPQINDPVIMVTDRLILNHHLHIIPYALRDLLSCSDLTSGSEYLWWRSISAAYLLRPNRNLLQLIASQRDKTVQATNGRCVSAYIRHGDKHCEMKLQPFSAYADVALQLFDKLDSGEHIATRGNVSTVMTGTSVPTTSTSTANKAQAAERVLYLATEDYTVFKEAREWGAVHNVKVIFSELSQILQTSAEVVTPRNLQKNLPKNKEMEFFSYFLHLFDEAQCVFTVCTHASNFCRLIDSIRSTVGGKANQYNVDLSAESCENPPCWRRNSLGNYNGTVYNPTRIVWRG